MIDQRRALGIPRCALRQLPHRVVDVHASARTCEPHRPVEVLRLLIPVGVDEDEIKNLPVRGQLRKDVQRGAEADGDVGHVLGVLDGDGAARRVDLDAGDLDVWGGVGEPERGVAAQRADFEDVLGLDQLAEDGEILALGGPDRYGGKAVGFGVGEGIFELRVGFDDSGLRVVSGAEYGSEAGFQ
nr:hypothetical protein CFP56_04036 [Quercus suber]